MSGSNSLLGVENLTMQFGGLRAIEDLSMSARAGEVTAVIGPNGAGKTTFFNCLTGFYKPTKGSIKLRHPYRGELRLDAMRNVDVARVGQVVRTFQNIRLFPRMTVLENLMIAQHNVLQEASRFSIAGALNSRSFRRANDKAIDNALTWLERLSVRDIANKPAGDMPYGVQRRVEIARAMCAEPILLCLDEPAAGLNPRESGELTTLLTSLSRDQGIGILLIEHDMSVVMKVSDHIVVLNHGKKIAEGPPAEIKTNSEVISAYLGEDDETSSPDGSSQEKTAHA
ncbi:MULTISPECIES: ABC transporter ATP-binding protein [Paraburkholderia]|jgi:branched-chain amino acid transport system ATP-binding protein|uniref:Branched-chain amino acid transport system ATP-binding protein n=1 Tax=Paraburkholderia phenazinium TaxID=60549 RepID=A0A1N6JPU3_9BURK|nr:ATP-binding cassette domain-containing protein [Paraburkholderia phenazinium]SIO46281.1 branched-chain amino acid transport system ATP-binding protein [Paraburkholderia phenazinium]